MGLAHSPSIVTNGLVLCLDAANQKSFLSSVEVLVVAGGGSGGSTRGGGGGAGGLLIGTTAVQPQSYTITVGNGGTATAHSGDGQNGNNTTAFGLTAIGGGAGRRSVTSGNSGGSGGGAGNSGGVTFSGGAGTVGQGNDGGGNVGQFSGGGGGGGAGTAGAAAPGGAGGNGIASTITGISTFYAGGGGGGRNSASAGAGGLGGGGNGGINSGGISATVNTGGGGGGAFDSTGGAGGSGIVIVRYPGPQRATGGTVTSVNGDTVHTFTSSGTFTPNIISDLRGGNNGTLVNGVGYSSANQGSLVFDGVDDFVTIPFNSNFNVTSNPFTVIVWNKKNTNTNGFNGLITADLAGDNTWKIYKDNNEAFYKCRAGSMTGLSFPGYTVNQWHQYAFTKSGTSLINYFDGQPVNSTASATNPTSFSNDLALGSYRLNDAIAGAYLMDQNFSQILFYNRALTAAEIQQNFNALRGRFGI